MTKSVMASFTTSSHWQALSLQVPPLLPIGAVLKDRALGDELGRGCLEVDGLDSLDVIPRRSRAAKSGAKSTCFHLVMCGALTSGHFTFHSWFPVWCQAVCGASGPLVEQAAAKPDASGQPRPSPHFHTSMAAGKGGPK